MSKSNIPWTDYTWNVSTGCTKKSAGCKNCYAENLHNMRHEAYKKGKLQNMPQYAEPFSKVQLHPERLGQPLHWKKPCKVFVNSMSDLFHESVPFDFIFKVLNTIAFNEQHTFQILTKRPENALNILKIFYSDAHLRHREIAPIPNLWIGVSVENQKVADERIPLLLQIPATVRFISVEPMLGPIKLTSSGLLLTIII